MSDMEEIIEAAHEAWVNDPDANPHFVDDSEQSLTQAIAQALTQAGCGRVDVAPANQWQPIETAPKDGTPVDLWCGGSRRTDCEWREPTDREYWVHGSDEPSDGEQTIGAEPRWFSADGWPMGFGDKHTHWMPLPQPPETE